MYADPFLWRQVLQMQGTNHSWVKASFLFTMFTFIQVTMPLQPSSRYRDWCTRWSERPIKSLPPPSFMVKADESIEESTSTWPTTSLTMTSATLVQGEWADDQSQDHKTNTLFSGTPWAPTPTVMSPTYPWTTCASPISTALPDIPTCFAMTSRAWDTISTSFRRKISATFAWPTLSPTERRAIFKALPGLRLRSSTHQHTSAHHQSWNHFHAFRATRITMPRV